MVGRPITPAHLSHCCSTMFSVSQLQPLLLVLDTTAMYKQPNLSQQLSHIFVTMHHLPLKSSACAEAMLPYECGCLPMVVNPAPDLASPPKDDFSRTEGLYSNVDIFQREDLNPVTSKLLFICYRDPLHRGRNLIKLIRTFLLLKRVG